MSISDWLRVLLLAFYAPTSALREVRDHASIAPAGLVALTTHAVFFASLMGFYFAPVFSLRRPFTILFLLSYSAGVLLFLALVLVPFTVFLVNIFDRRASFRLVLQQEYSTTTASVFFAWSLASLVALLLNVAGKLTNVVPNLGARMFGAVRQQVTELPPDMLRGIDINLLSPEVAAAAVVFLALLAIFGIWLGLSIRVLFRTSWLQCGLVVVFSGIFLFPAWVFLQPIFITILGSPFLVFILFLLLRGYVTEMSRVQRARESFKQNLEAATLNPADSSAHYNLGLIHQQRGELEEARERFERAVQIDEEEIDAHYQLGRIARQQKRLADAIRHFEQVVARDPTHAQHEIWREVGSTYLAAGQYEDARNALERFLERRSSDPEALYLMGRAHAGLGHRREAASLMQACIEAVKTAPAYKYRSEKRWLNEAQQFIKGGSQ